MTSYAMTLFLGVLLIVAAFMLVYRGLRWQGKQAAILVALGVIGVYIPLAIVYWPGADVFAIHLAIYLVSVYVLGIVTMSRDARRQAGDVDARWFHWGPAAIVIFFACIVAVDAILLVVAQQGLGLEVARHILPAPQGGGDVSSFFPGTVQHNYQQKEDQYNEYRERLAEQRERGWTVHKGWVGKAVVGLPAHLRIEVLDHKQRAVMGASVHGRFMRAADSRLDRAFVMTESKPGIYETEVILTASGRWDLTLQILKDGEVHEVAAVTSVQDAAN